MVQMKIEMPEGPLAALRQDPTGFVKELRLTALEKVLRLGSLAADVTRHPHLRT